MKRTNEFDWFPPIIWDYIAALAAGQNVDVQKVSRGEKNFSGNTGLILFNLYKHERQCCDSRPNINITFSDVEVFSNANIWYYSILSVLRRVHSLVVGISPCMVSVRSLNNILV